MRRLIEYSIRKMQQLQQVLSSLVADHFWQTQAETGNLNITAIAGNTQARISKLYSSWGVEIPNSITVNMPGPYWNSRYWGQYDINRAVFDIASLGGIVATAATIKLSRAATSVDAGNAYLFGLTRTTPGTTSGGDWSKYSAQAFSALTTYNITTNEIIFELNEAGIAYLNQGGISFMIRSANDVDNFAPTTTQTITLFTAISGTATYTIDSVTLTDGLVSAVADAGTDSTLVPLTQTDANYRPQRGYDKVAVYDASILLDGLVTNFTNTAVTTSRNLPTIVGVSGSAPSKTGDYLVFSNTKSLITAITSRNVKAATLVGYFKVGLVSINVDSSQTYYINYCGETRITVYIPKNTTLVYFNFVFYSVNNQCNFSSTIDYWNANYANKDIFFVARFCETKQNIIINNIQLQQTLLALPYTTISQIAIYNAYANSSLYIKHIAVYYSYLSDSELNLLYINKDSNTYQLPQVGITSNGSQFMKALIMPVNYVVTKLTISAWVYLANVTEFATISGQDFLNTKNFLTPLDAGFQLKIYKISNLNCRFRVAVGNSTTITAINSPQLSLTAFRSQYVGSWFSIAFTIETNNISDTLSLFINAANVAATTSATGILNSGTGEILVGARSDGYNIGAGNRIDLLRIHNRALTATEMKRQDDADKAKYAYLSQ